MTMYYQTLREHGLTMTVDGTSVAIDVVVTLVGVEFPPNGVCFLCFVSLFAITRRVFSVLARARR